MIITKRFFDGRTQMEVADEIGISQAQVSRLEKNAIEHIKRLYKQLRNIIERFVYIIIIYKCQKKYKNFDEH